MARSKAEKQRRRSEAKRKIASDHQPFDRRKKRKLNDLRGVRGKEHQSTDDQSEEALFKIRYAAEFDGESVTEIGDQTKVKQEEYQHSTGDTIDASQSTLSIAGERPGHETSPRRPATKPDKAITDRVDHEDIMVTILSQTFWDKKMTQATIKTLAGRAQHEASPGNLFNLTYIDELLTRLDMSGIEAGRRSQIVTLLQHELYELLRQWRSSIRQVGGSECSIPPNIDASAVSQDPAGPVQGVVSSSSRLLCANARRHDEGGSPRHPMQQQQDTTSRSNNDEANSDDSGSEDDQNASGHEKSTTHRAIERQHSSSFLLAPGSSNMTHTTKSKDNLRVYGTLRPKAPFDIFARCVISAWALAPEQADEPFKIRAHARSKWKKVVVRHTEQRAGWQKLYEARHKPGIDVSALGHRLFLFQNLLQHVIPSERLRAISTRLQGSTSGPRRLEVPEPSSLSSSQRPQNFRFQYTKDATAGGYRILEHDNQAVARQARVDFRQSNLQMPITFAGSEAARLFPRLMQATSTMPSTQPCFVPASTREHDSNGCLFILNTPDTIAGRIINNPDVRVACTQASFEGFKDVIRHNYNMFVAYFDTRRRARHAGHVWALNFSVSSAEPKTTNASTLIVRPSWYLPGAHNLFCCSIPKTSTNTHATIFERVFEALDGPMVVSFQLLKQKADNDRVRYMLRRPPSAPSVYVERFYIPLDNASGDGKIWGIFKPMNMNSKCKLCKEHCQAGRSSTCPYTTVMKMP